jgi:hypothetical protein
MEYQEYKAKMAEAIASDNIAAIEELNSAWNKSKAERRKAELEAQRKEEEALAGAREKLAKQVHKAVTAIPNIIADLEAVKARGFTFKLNESDVTYKSVALTVPTIKTKRGGTGGGGKTKDEFGLSLQEVWDRFHTAEDKARMAVAEAADKAASERLGKTTNSNAWRIKTEVKKRALAEGLLEPIK